MKNVVVSSKAGAKTKIGERPEFIDYAAIRQNFLQIQNFSWQTAGSVSIDGACV